MPAKTPTPGKDTTIERPPVVCVMGHIDHGKSSLLDYIRKTDIVAGEAGGITQHVSAYEIEHKTAEGKNKKITFIDTPGHAAFFGIRKRGAKVADVAVLVVSAEDGVKPQTVEAYKAIEESKVPFVVAINKIDKPNANIEKTKISLAEAGVYLEGYGGNISFVPISAKTGEGIPELLDLILLSAEILDLKGNPTAPAEGSIVETSRDPKKGISATLIIKNGTLISGTTIVSGKSFAPARIIEDSNGKKITGATFSSPVRLLGWNEAPVAGDTFVSYASKKEAEQAIEKARQNAAPQKTSLTGTPAQVEGELPPVLFPLIIKADTAGSAEAIAHEIGKIKNDRVILKIVQSGLGTITESDVKFLANSKGAAIIGFNVSTDASAQALSERLVIPIMNFDIIYKISEWLVEESAKRTPKVMIEEVAGTAKILRFFSRTKDRQIVGGRVLTGEIKSGCQIKVMRNGKEIERGVVRGLEQAKVKTDEVKEGFEFGTNVEARIDLAPGDIIESIIMVEK